MMSDNKNNNYAKLNKWKQLTEKNTKCVKRMQMLVRTDNSRECRIRRLLSQASE